jgi:hypothetical protein
LCVRASSRRVKCASSRTSTSSCSGLLQAGAAWIRRASVVCPRRWLNATGAHCMRQSPLTSWRRRSARRARRGRTGCRPPCGPRA